MKTKFPLLVITLYLIIGSCHNKANSEINSTLKTISDNKNDSSFIKLPEPKYYSEISLEETLLKRRSVRDFKNKPISISDISQILWAAYGITKEIENSPAFLRGGLKTAPSAGALYPLEIYLVAGEIEKLEKGIYKYLPEKHALKLIIKGDFREELYRSALNQKMIKDAPANIVYSAVYERTTNKYGERGKKRYVCMDLGHSAQNVYLQATALGLGTCAIGAFNDDRVKTTINMPAEEEPLYIMPIGWAEEN
ncbi:MAG: SagB/ThcOx family dehydrogenase [Bacteroidales bacterium]|nr:SagB/ThcOx family dehydrogenase [Bacteroidales bacterium]